MSDIATVHKQVKDQWRRKRAQPSVESTATSKSDTPFVFTCCIQQMLLKRQTVAPTLPHTCVLLMNFCWSRCCSGYYYSEVNVSLLTQLALSTVCKPHSRRNVSQSWQVSPLMGNNQGYYRVITLWGEILSAIDKWQKLEKLFYIIYSPAAVIYLAVCINAGH